MSENSVDPLTNRIKFEVLLESCTFNLHTLTSNSIDCQIDDNLQQKSTEKKRRKQHRSEEKSLDFLQKLLCVVSFIIWQSINVMWAFENETNKQTEISKQNPTFGIQMLLILNSRYKNSLTFLWQNQLNFVVTRPIPFIEFQMDKENSIETDV